MYSRGKIYEIVCNKTGSRYVGSTCEPTLAKRLTKHVDSFKRWKLGKRKFVSSFIILEEGDYVINLLEMCPVNCRDELRMREQFYINLLENVNKHKAFRTEQEKLERRKEYYDQNKAEILGKVKEYQKDHKTEIAEYHKIYHDQNKAELAEYKKKYYKENKDKAKEYYQENKDEILEKKKEYRNKNRADINKKRRERRASKKIIEIDLKT